MPSARIIMFDKWEPGYGLATVRVLEAGTSVLADIFSDEDLTVSIANPQTLIQTISTDGISYGKFAATVYIGVPYELDINSVDRTGVQRIPITTLDEEDASDAFVTITGGSQEIALADHLARAIDVRDFGEFKAVGEQGASTATNTATLVSAIGVAGGRGGGFVRVPAGTFAVSEFNVPEGVVVQGESRDGTILKSTQAGIVATVGGDRAGFARVTLDGLSQVALSVGIFAADVAGVILDDVTIKRFELGLRVNGGGFNSWRDLIISDCVNGYQGRGTHDADINAELRLNHWRGGKVELCTTIGVDLTRNSNDTIDNIIADVHFDTNTGTAVRVKGALASSFRDCRWSGNTTNLAILDEDSSHQTIGVEIDGGSIDTGAVTLTGLLENVAFRHVRLTDIDVAITTPTNTILIEDCEEDGVAISGDATYWLRHETGDQGATFGLTTGNTATKAWAITLDAGDHVYLEAKVIGRRINAVAHAYYHIAVSARRPGASLAYDTQTGNFTAGNTLTGATSGATARIQADSDSGSTGILTLLDVVGTFVDNEIITDGSTGSATANGTQSYSDATLVGSATALRTAQETDSAWDATFVANGPQIEMRVTGNTGHTIEWTSDITVVRN